MESLDNNKLGATVADACHLMSTLLREMFLVVTRDGISALLTKLLLLHVGSAIPCYDVPVSRQPNTPRMMLQRSNGGTLRSSLG